MLTEFESMMLCRFGIAVAIFSGLFAWYAVERVIEYKRSGK